MKLLFITQKLHGQDAFGILWVRAFIRQGFDVTVLCLEGPEASFEFPVLSLGKEQGASRLRSILRFYSLILTQRTDRVFIHMAPVWYALACWWWLLRGTPVYLWYTHYRMQLGVRLFGFFGRRFFCATPQSLPQYEGHRKKIVCGHGIDLSFWPKRRNLAMHSTRLLVVHRLSRSKRLEIVLRALTFLDASYTLDIYGIEAEQDYVAEMKALVADLHLEPRVTFHGTVPMAELPEIYVRHRFILNMASETIDKTMLEAMTCGCYPVTTTANAAAIGLPEGVREDTPEAVAHFLTTYHTSAPLDADAMVAIVEARHSLHRLVETMAEYIRRGD